MLRALHLTKSYDGAPLFEGLSLTLNPGDRAGLVGANGAGKSTLLRLLAGRERADRGSIFATATVGYLPQEAPDVHDRRPAARRVGRGRRGARRPPAPRRPRRLRARARARRGDGRLGRRGARRGGPPPARRSTTCRRPPAEPPLGRRAGPRAAGRHAAPGPGRPAARRAHQPPRRRRPRPGSRVPGRLRRRVLVVSHDRALPRRRRRAASTSSATASSTTRAATPPTATSRPAAARGSRSSPPRRTSAAAGSRPTSPTRATTPAAPSAPPAALGADKQKRYAKKVAKKAKAREGRLEREMAPTRGSSGRARPRPCASSSTPPPTAGGRVAALRGVGAAVLSASTSRSTAASASRSPAPTAPARRRCCSCCSARWSRAAGEVHMAASVRLLPQRPQDVAADRPAARRGSAATPPRHRRVRGAHAARPLRPRRRRGRTGRSSASAPASVRARAIAAIVASERRPAAARRADQPPRLRHARGAGDRAAKSPSTIVAVSHDRWFLDAIGTTRHLHVQDGAVYEGSSTSSRE